MERLTSAYHNPGVPNECHVFECSDGVTRMPFSVLGKLQLQVTRVNFVVMHDLFDTLDGTCLLFKPVVNRHVNCQVSRHSPLVAWPASA